LLAACPAGRSEGSRRSGTAIASPSPTAPVGVCRGKPAPFPSSADLIRNRTIRLPESFGQEIAGHPQCPECSAVRQPRARSSPRASDGANHETGLVPSKGRSITGPGRGAAAPRYACFPISAGCPHVHRSLPAAVSGRGNPAPYSGRPAILGLGSERRSVSVPGFPTLVDSRLA
jgi:hypothetical protein